VTPPELEQLEAALRQHMELLEDALGRDDFLESPRYLSVAAQLRVLLCDADIPILLRYATEKGKPLFVWCPPPFPESLLPGLASLISPCRCGWEKTMPADEQHLVGDFLDMPIGYEPVSDPIGNKTMRPYTPRQLIKWLSNKEGACHLDLNKPQVLKSLKNWKWRSAEREFENPWARRAIQQIGIWAYMAIGNVLGLK
jgi:hypothetical protein